MADFRTPSSLPSKPHIHWQSPSIPCSLLPLANTNISVSLNLSIPVFHRNGNHTVCGIFHLTSLTWQNVFRVHLCGSVYQYFIPFHSWIIIHCMDISHLFIHSSADKTLRLFPLLVYYKQCRYELHVQTVYYFYNLKNTTLEKLQSVFSKTVNKSNFLLM